MKSSVHTYEDLDHECDKFSQFCIGKVRLLRVVIKALGATIDLLVTPFPSRRHDAKEGLCKRKGGNSIWQTGQGMMGRWPREK